MRTLAKSRAKPDEPERPQDDPAYRDAGQQQADAANAEQPEPGPEPEPKGAPSDDEASG